MTCQVKLKTKKALKEAAANGSNIDIYDPSIFNERRFSTSEMKAGDHEVVTYHPRRSWFAVIEKHADGTVTVS
ncbi:MAG: hypothetical protein DRI65_13595 [Chloroflexota bacterium]|nr:MAG: hypothetical protein DRI65_13595 [Chloroflexota bacterium]